MASGKVQVVSSKSGLPSYFNEAGLALNSQLQNFMPIIQKLRLRKQIEYALQAQGKRLRSTIVFLSGESVGADKSHLQKLALGIELLHLATLVHDDILDHDEFRRNALSVQTMWGVKEAILVGDAFASLGLSLGKNYPKGVLEIMVNTCLQLSDGEFMDVKMTPDTLSEEYYLEKTRKKSASLFKAAAECGAIAGGGCENEISSLREFGENYGLAFQIRDDLTDFSSSKNRVPSDLNEFRATLPIIHLNQKLGKDANATIRRLINNKRDSGGCDRTLLKELESLLKKSGSVDFCFGRIDYYVQEAISSLESLRESIYKNYLKQMVETLRLK